jgi:4-diphosphocytidyl-2-C-methyl-D-erythritol kinase
LNLGPVKIHLHKIIPMGAGLGGGSSDAAFTLRLLNSIFELKISEETLKQYASRLGSDCSFFVRDIPQDGNRKGRNIEPDTIQFEGEVYSDHYTAHPCFYSRGLYGCNPCHEFYCNGCIITNDISSWRNLLKNDFEESVFRNHPQDKGNQRKVIPA